MDWNAPIDIYCERLGPGFWAEPVNALTNGAFLLAALVGAAAARRAGLRHPALWALIGLAALIGVGSFLFHTVATPWAALTDVVPIWTFVALYLWTFATRVTGIRPVALLGAAALAIAALVALVAGLRRVLGPAAAALNGSEQYAPALLALVVFAVLLARRRHHLAPLVTGIAGLFALSLGFRTADMHVCDALPLGTHFLWHLLNGTVIALLLVALVRGLAHGR